VLKENGHVVHPEIECFAATSEPKKDDLKNGGFGQEIEEKRTNRPRCERAGDANRSCVFDELEQGIFAPGTVAMGIFEGASIVPELSVH
jgi:hypothetical protein